MIKPLKKPKRTKAKCLECDSKEIYRGRRCYEHFRIMANKKLREYRQKNPVRFKQYEINKNLNSKERKCKYCGKSFKRYYRGVGFCSRTCNYKFIVENKIRKGKNNPAYRNGCYVEEKRKKNKTAIKHLEACKKYRKHFREITEYDYCELCGTSNSLRFETHHIIFASEAPKHKELHNFKNLIYLCIRCHNELHKHKIKRKELVKLRGLNELFGKNLIVYDKNINQAVKCK